MKILTVAWLCLLGGCSVAAGPRPDATEMNPVSTADSGGDAHGAGVAETETAVMDTLVREYVAKNQFMGAVLVSRGDGLLLDRAYGYANAEWKVPHTTGSRFRIGSVSKQFTAVLALLLEQEGKLRVEDPLAQHLPDVPAAWAGMTLHHLLSHTSGLPDLVARPDYPVRRTQPSSPQRNYETLRDLPLGFAPGTKFQYSNSGYLVLALVIERITGHPYDRVLRERLLDPLGLADTGSDAARPLLERRADGYVPLATTEEAGEHRGAPFRNADFIDMSVPIGAGGLYSTTADLHRWTKALFAGNVLTPASFAKMTTLHAGNYGYGLFLGEYQGLRRVGHGGSIHGFLTSLTFFPEHDVVVIVLANLTAGGPVGELYARLVDLALAGPGSDAGAGN